MVDLGLTQNAMGGVAVFLASLVECIEALTIVLAVGTVRGWLWSLLGAACGGRLARAGSRSSGLTSSGDAIANAAKNVKIARPVIPRPLDRNVAQ